GLLGGLFAGHGHQHVLGGQNVVGGPAADDLDQGGDAAGGAAVLLGIDDEGLADAAADGDVLVFEQLQDGVLVVLQGGPRQRVAGGPALDRVFLVRQRLDQGLIDLAVLVLRHSGEHTGDLDGRLGVLDRGQEVEDHLGQVGRLARRQHAGGGGQDGGVHRDGGDLVQCLAGTLA